MFRVSRATLIAMLSLCFCLPVFAQQAQDQPLVLRGDNTVIMGYGESYALPWLQYYLLKAVVKLPDANSYTRYPEKGAERPDITKATAFPVLGRGVEIPDGKNAIIIATVDKLPEQYLTKEEREMLSQKRGSILVKREGNNVLLVKNTQNQWYFAHINVFLDKVCGVRLYAPSDKPMADEELWLSMPTSEKITIDKLNIAMMPYFAKAQWTSTGRNLEWGRLNGCVIEGSAVRATHGIINYFPPDKYYDKYPQLYPMGVDGNRPKPTANYWNPCLADPELAAKIAMETIDETMAKQPTKDYFSFGVMDTPYRCNDPICQKSLKEHGGNAATLWYTFLNIVARECKQKYPNLYLSSYNYANVGMPKDIKVESNIVIDNVIKTYMAIDDKSFAGMKQEILDIASTGASWVTHDWDFSGVTPRLYSTQYASFLQWGFQNNMLGGLTEWSPLEYWYLDGPKYWVSMQLWSNPYQNPQKLWLQYSKDMFGDGWEEMYKFYDMFQQKYVVGDAYHARMDWPREEAAAFTAQDVAQQRQWLETAISKTATDPMAQKRLAIIMRYFNAHELLVQAVSTPARLYHKYTRLEGQTGINKEALAYYVNDDGKKIVEFDRYYDQERTVAPDSNAEDKNSSMRFSYRNNYSRALGTIIGAINRQAMAGLNANTATASDVKQVAERAKKIFNDNLPKKYSKKRAKELASLTEKFIFVPRKKDMPKFDGDLSDDTWKGAAELNDWTIADLLVPSIIGNKTTGKMMRIGDHIVIGIVCHQPRGIWAQTTKDQFTGSSIYREASCEFLLGPAPAQGEKPDYFQYVVNALGGFRGYRTARDNREGVTCAVNWDKDKNTYTIEVAFPLKVQGRYDYTQAKAFSFNIMQNPFEGNTFNSPERIGWAPIFFTAHYEQSRALIIIE